MGSLTRRRCDAKACSVQDTVYPCHCGGSDCHRRKFVRTAMWYVPRVSFVFWGKFEILRRAPQPSSRYSICIRSHSACAAYLSLHDRDNSMSCVEHLRSRTNWDMILSLKLAIL
jgi:hypothetical protein